MPKNFFDSFSVSTAAVVGVPSAIGLGIASGLSQSALAAQNASAVLTNNSGERDSLLKSLKALFDDQEKQDHSALESFGEIKEGLMATNDFFAFVIKNVLLSGVSGI